MGRRNNHSYDEILLTKTKSIICRVLDELNGHDEIENAHALYSKETIDRVESANASSSSSSSGESRDKVKWPVTYEQFVENLDCQDRFVKNLSELLVGETIRKAVYSSLSRAEESKSIWDASTSSSDRLEVGWQQKWEQSQRTRREVDKVTRASRRSSSWGDVYSLGSSSSSESELSLDVNDYSNIPRAPPSVLLYRQREEEEAATTRPTRAQRSGALQQRSSLAERATIARARQHFLQDSRQWRQSRRNRVEEQARYQMERLQRQASSNNLAEQAASAAAAITSPRSIASIPRPILQTSEAPGDPTDGLIHRFLTQPFPSEARNISNPTAVLSPRGNFGDLPAVSAVASDVANGVSSDSLRDVTGVDPAALSIGHSTSTTQITSQPPRSRLGEFERFAHLRRQNRRSREEMTMSRRSQLQSPATEGLAREEDTYYRALDTLWQADETIRLVSQETNAGENGAGSTLRARRYQLPSLNEGRPTVRLPARASRREDDNGA